MRALPAAIWRQQRRPSGSIGEDGHGVTSTLVEAVNLALARALAEDERVLVLGEDVGVDGGVFRATAGLLARFGA